MHSHQGMPPLGGLLSALLGMCTALDIKRPHHKFRIGLNLVTTEMNRDFVSEEHEQALDIPQETLQEVMGVLQKQLDSFVANNEHMLNALKAAKDLTGKSAQQQNREMIHDLSKISMKDMEEFDDIHMTDELRGAVLKHRARAINKAHAEAIELYTADCGEVPEGAIAA